MFCSIAFLVFFIFTRKSFAFNMAARSPFTILSSSHSRNRGSEPFWKVWVKKRKITLFFSNLRKWVLAAVEEESKERLVSLSVKEKWENRKKNFFSLLPIRLCIDFAGVAPRRWIRDWTECEAASDRKECFPPATKRKEEKEENEKKKTHFENNNDNVVS